MVKVCKTKSKFTMFIYFTSSYLQMLFLLLFRTLKQDKWLIFGTSNIKPMVIKSYEVCWYSRLIVPGWGKTKTKEISQMAKPWLKWSKTSEVATYTHQEKEEKTLIRFLLLSECVIEWYKSPPPPPNDQSVISTTLIYEMVYNKQKGTIIFLTNQIL